MPYRYRWVLAKALELNFTLTQLDLCCNDINDNGAINLARALETNRSLTFLSISTNFIGVEGATALGKALRINLALSHLDLSYGADCNKTRQSEHSIM